MHSGILKSDIKNVGREKGINFAGGVDYKFQGPPNKS